MAHLNTLVLSPSGIEGVVDSRVFVRAPLDDIDLLAETFSASFEPLPQVAGLWSVRAPMSTNWALFVLALETCFGTFDLEDFEGSETVH